MLEMYPRCFSRPGPRGSGPRGSPLARRLSAWMCALATTVSAQAFAQGLGGIHHYELVVLGPAAPDAANVAWEVTDCGLVVGQILRDPGGLVPRRLQAFAYSTRTLPGLPAGAVLFLPGGSTAMAPWHSAARDANDQGWIVGDLRVEESEEPGLGSIGAAWHIHPDGNVLVQLVDPPMGVGFRDYAAGGFGWLSSLSDGELPWAAGNFSLNQNCFGGGTGLARESIVAVRLSGDTGPAEFRLLCENCPSAASTEPGRVHASGISRGATWLCGSRETCGYEMYCGLALGLAAQSWFAPHGACQECSGALACAWCRTPNPNDQDRFLGAAHQFSILEDGAAVGFVADHWIDGAGAGIGCSGRAYVWDPVAECGELECDPANPPASLGVVLPTIATVPIIHSRAVDLEKTAFAAQGVAPGFFAVGRVETAEPDGTTAVTAYLWFGQGGVAASVLGATWAAMPADDAYSPIVPGYSQCNVVALCGVNRRGDAVGKAKLQPVSPLVAPQDAAVLLRAVPIACVGDLNHDGEVGAPDLAMMLGTYCGPGSAGCDPVADLDLNGAVGATDLAALLSNWGPTPCDGPCEPDATPVPALLALNAQMSVESAMYLVGLHDIEGYRAWAPTVPAELRAIVDEAVWNLSKEGVE